eukprot:scaffold277731_cov30-Tisochrysis_lutea.AAC.1
MRRCAAQETQRTQQSLSLRRTPRPARPLLRVGGGQHARLVLILGRGPTFADPPCSAGSLSLLGAALSLGCLLSPAHPVPSAPISLSIPPSVHSRGSIPAGPASLPSPPFMSSRPLPCFLFPPVPHVPLGDRRAPLSFLPRSPP